MTVTIMDFSDFVDSNYVRVSFDILTAGKGDSYDRRLTGITLNEFDSSTNTGKWWSGEYFVNTFAWSEKGIFKRLNHSLYFYSDDLRKQSAQYADFVLHYAPAEPHDYLANHGGVVRDGIGKIINPRNPSWAGTQIEWYRTDVQTEDKEDEEQRERYEEERAFGG